MSADKKVTRRTLLQTGMLAAAGAVGGKLFAAGTEAPSCKVTPTQTSGPFYPSEDQADEDLDLTLVEGHGERAKGEVLYVRGRILDEECQPVADALVEIWQANTYGRYHHERDTNPAPRDPNFQGWGEVVTNSRGEYGFRTIVPGPYRAGRTMRTRHIHFRVSRRGFHEKITQMYFEGEELNGQDSIWKDLSPDERAQVTVEKEKNEGTNGSDGSVCRFDVVMHRV